MAIRNRWLQPGLAGDTDGDEIEELVGFTEATIDRILRELTIAGTLSKSSGFRHGLRYQN